MTPEHTKSIRAAYIQSIPNLTALVQALEPSKDDENRYSYEYDQAHAMLERAKQNDKASKRVAAMEKSMTTAPAHGERSEG